MMYLIQNAWTGAVWSASRQEALFFSQELLQFHYNVYKNGSALPCGHFEI